MKLLLIAVLLFFTAGVSKDKETIIRIKTLSSHKGDIWTVYSFGYLDSWYVPHASNVLTNNVLVRWNVKKGRLSISCGKLCDTTDTYLIRLFDKDSLRIDFVAGPIEASRALSDSEYIVPASMRGDIAYMEILPINDDWRPHYKVQCDDGYTANTSDFGDCDFLCDFLEITATTCIKPDTEETDDDYTPDGGWYSDNNDCPPSWQDSNGNCKKGW